MIQNVLEQLNSFLTTWKTIYNEQSQAVKILVPGFFLLVSCCLCSILIPFFPFRNSPRLTPSPVLYPTQGTQATPTALFNFGSTPFPTLVAPTALPTTPSPATVTPTPTQIESTATLTLAPTSTNTNLPATAANTGSVKILTVNKPAEYVDIQNVGNGSVNLNGWKLLSVTGNQSCTLSGILQPSEVLRIWSGKGSPGLSCGYSFNIWNDTQADPAVLYDAQGQEVSRFP